MAQLRIKRSGVKSQPALQIIFTSSQSYTIESKWKSADIFVVGGGGSGGRGQSSGNNYKGGSGGGSGYTTTSKNITLTSDILYVTIGAGGLSPSSIAIGNDGSQSSITYNSSQSVVANGGKGGSRYSSSSNRGDGGSGGGAAYGGSDTTGSISISRFSGNAGSNGGNGGNAVRHDSSAGTQTTVTTGGDGQLSTTRAFQEGSGTLYAGGGGAAGSDNQAWFNPADGTPGGAGGGGGNGINDNANNATANTGGGGAGSRISASLAGNGGSGIVIVRLYKNSDRPTDIDWSQNTINL